MDYISGKVYYKLFEDIVCDLLQDSSLKDFVDYECKPLFKDGERMLGPASSGLLWEAFEFELPDKTIILMVFYSDATQFYKKTSAHPVFGKNMSWYNNF